MGAEDRVSVREEENVGISIRQVFNAVDYHTRDDEKYEPCNRRVTYNSYTSS